MFLPEFVWTSTKNAWNGQNAFRPSITRDLITGSDHLSRKTYAKQSVELDYEQKRLDPMWANNDFRNIKFFLANWKDFQVLPFILLLSIKFTGLVALMLVDFAQPKKYPDKSLVESTLTLLTPLHNEHPGNTDSS